MPAPTGSLKETYRERDIDGKREIRKRKKNK